MKYRLFTFSYLCIFCEMRFVNVLLSSCIYEVRPILLLQQYWCRPVRNVSCTKKIVALRNHGSKWKFYPQKFHGWEFHARKNVQPPQKLCLHKNFEGKKKSSQEISWYQPTSLFLLWSTVRQGTALQDSVMRNDVVFYTHHQGEHWFINSVFKNQIMLSWTLVKD